MAKGKKGKNKFSYTSPLKKQVNKQIRQLGKDGKLNKKDVRKFITTIEKTIIETLKNFKAN